MTNEETVKKSTSDAFSEMWSKLEPNQQRYAIAALEFPSKKDAAESIGLKVNTVYKWGEEVTAVVDFMRSNAALAALGIITANATKAAMIKAAGLDSDSEKIRQDAATEVLDRNLGRPTQRQEHTGADGGVIRVSLIDND